MGYSPELSCDMPLGMTCTVTYLQKSIVGSFGITDEKIKEVVENVREEITHAAPK